MNMVERRCRVHVPRGIHCRVAVRLAETVAAFCAEVFISTGGERARLASVVDVLSLGISCGTRVVLSGSGPDASKALNAVEQVLVWDSEC